MAIPVSENLTPTSVTREEAAKAADLYLMDHVGDLLTTGPAHLSSGFWEMPIVLSHIGGTLGSVGR
jgi:hypothetical protein